jgi:hypothetical protein
LDKRTELIVDALRMRLLQVRAEAKSILPAAFGEFRDDVAGMVEVLVHGKLEPTVALPTEWLVSDDDCFTCLKGLSVGETVSTRPAIPPGDDLLSLLKSTRKDPLAQFQLLTSHYAFPLNFALSSEERVREYVLGRVMTQHRSSIEGAVVVDNEDLCLCLNLLAVNALFTTDLRYLDALNYFYEKSPARTALQSDRSLLKVSYLVLYATALVANMERLRT